MDSKLLKEVQEFYDEMDKDESFEIGYIACSLVPKLVLRIENLEKENEKYQESKQTKTKQVDYNGYLDTWDE